MTNRGTRLVVLLSQGLSASDFVTMVVSGSESIMHLVVVIIALTHWCDAFSCRHHCLY